MTGLAAQRRRLAGWLAGGHLARRTVRLVCVAMGTIGMATPHATGQQSPLLRLFQDVQHGFAAAEGAADAAEPNTSPPNSTPQPESGAVRPLGNQGGGPTSNNGVEALPPPRVEGTLPLGGAPIRDRVHIIRNSDGSIEMLRVLDAPLSHVLDRLAETYELNILTPDALDATITTTLRNVDLEEALTAILSVKNYTWVLRNNIIVVTSLVGGAENFPPDVQGRQIQVFELDFASASEVARAVGEFLSPIGRVTVNESDPTNNRRTRESIVVEDLPQALTRIAAYVNYADRPPRQVLIEAHILQVNLRDENYQGVNLNALIRLAGTGLRVQTPGFADAAASPAFVATIDNGDLMGSVIELLQTSNDTKSLGAPKLLVVNEQEARIHVGESIGFQGSQTTTETSTFQNAQFIDVGVVLRITPRITRDNRVLLHVKPEVSTGAINPVTQLPDTATAELETSIMLNDGQGMVIGGLIRETDSVVQNKVPYLGDVKGLGWFFRRSEVTKERNEIIFALVPRILPYDCEYQAYEQGELVKAGVSLFDGPLKRTYRPWDPVLPDGVRVAEPIIPRRLPYSCDDPPGTYPRGTGYYISRHPLPEQRFCDDDCLECYGPTLRSAPLPLLSDESGTVISDDWGGVEIFSDQE